ncbi:anaerobic glycerol-3-phosphate dehydrogenase subunit C [Deferribacterales bacterium RsTz2092]|nr:sn-glycerol-3-phosphate dehydrogenase subunit C [Deferribacterales bacterium]
MAVHYHKSPDACVACTTCTAYCPVAAHTQNYQGPKLTAPAGERFRLLGEPDDSSLSYCSNCKICDMSCPYNVPISVINMMARADYCAKNPPPLRDWLVAHGELLANLTSILPNFLRNWVMNSGFVRSILDFMGIAKEMPLPNFVAKTFKQAYKNKLKSNKADAVAAADINKTLVYFPGCYVNIYEPQTGFDVVEVLKQAGYHVIVPDNFCCCGLPLVANGYMRAAKHNAVKNSAELDKWRNEGIPVLTSCPSCGLMLKREYGELFPDIAGTEHNAKNIYDVCEFIGSLIESGCWKGSFRTDAPISAIYHTPCHSRVQGCGKPGLQLALNLPNVSAIDADAGCCGMSGSYGFKKDKYSIAMNIGSSLFQTIDASGAQCVITECGICQLQIRHGISKKKEKRVMHPITLLKERLIF